MAAPRHQHGDRDADAEHAGSVARVRVPRDDAVEQVLRPVEGAYEDDGDDRHHSAKDDVGRQHRDALRCVHGGDDERRRVAEQALADVRGGCGRERDRDQRTHADLVEQHLDREEDSADRRVEGGGDAGPSAGGDESRPLPPRHAGETTEP